MTVLPEGVPSVEQVVQVASQFPAVQAVLAGDLVGQIGAPVGEFGSPAHQIVL